LVRLGEQEIDFSPQFSMIMLTRDSTFQFTPDICSRVTFVNFTMTPASLKAQCLSNALKHERPDVDAKRVELIKLKGEYQADIRELEANLLETLSKTEGNILDNDALMQSLVDLKTKSTEVTEKMANCDSELEVVRIVTDHFEVFARVCSDVFFCSQRIAGVQILYQFSYKFFLSIVDTVLSTGDGTQASSTKDDGTSPRSRRAVPSRLRRGLRARGVRVPRCSPQRRAASRRRMHARMWRSNRPCACACAAARRERRALDATAWRLSGASPQRSAARALRWPRQPPPPPPPFLLLLHLRLRLLRSKRCVLSVIRRSSAPA
jgi:hypothetical protein